MVLTWPNITAGPVSPGEGDPEYQPAGAPGPSGGTSRDALSRSPSFTSGDFTPMAGTVTVTGAGAGRAGEGTFAAEAAGAVVLPGLDGEGGLDGIAADTVADGVPRVGADDGASVPHPLKRVPGLR